MRRLSLIVLFALGLALPAIGQARDEITSVIQRQIEAFQLDDFETAFSFASPNIKRLFGSSDRFGMMVQQGYPMVHRPGEIEYLDKSEKGAVTYQKVRIFDKSGVAHTLEYEMIETPNGWQINGVRFLQPPTIGA